MLREGGFLSAQPGPEGSCPGPGWIHSGCQNKDFLDILIFMDRVREHFESKPKEKIMQKVENGKFVSVDYKGTLDSGEVFDTTEGRNPVELQVGAGQIIKGFEDELVGMELNEKKTFTLSPEDAYGARDENNVHTFAREEVPAEMNPQVGEIIGLQTPEGQQIPARVAEFDDEKLVVDLNHPLADQNLTFEIEVVGINDAPTQMPEGCSSCGSGCSPGCC
jgi:peptidylprolyl isomerase